MQEFEKHEARNYLSAAGFFITAVFGLLYCFTHFSPELITDTFVYVNAVLVLALIIIGILLAAIGGRGFTSVTFLMIGMFLLTFSFAPELSVITGGALIIFALSLLCTTDRKKILIFFLPILIGLCMIIREFINPTAGCVCMILLVVLSLWYAFASMAERARLPASTILKSDDETNFKSAGAVLGYFIFALVCSAWGLYYLLTENFIPLESVEALTGVSSLMLVFIGILLYGIAKMRFTPVLFILTGVLLGLTLYVSGILVILIGALFIILGIFAFLREESRLLPGLMLIFFGLTGFVSVLITGNFSFGPFQGVFNLIPAVIAIYLSFALFSENKLPLF